MTAHLWSECCDVMMAVFPAATGSPHSSSDLPCQRVSALSTCPSSGTWHVYPSPHNTWLPEQLIRQHRHCIMWRLVGTNIISVCTLLQ